MVDMVRSLVTTDTVVTPGTPVTEKSRSDVVEIALLVMMLLTMNWVVVGLRDWTGWTENTPVFAPDVKKVTVEPVSSWLLLRIQN